MKSKKFIFIGGPCVIESRSQAFRIAGALKDITSNFPLRFIFKASFDKANRTSIKSFRGPGLKQGLKILKDIKKHLKIPVLSDVHSPDQVKEASRVLDVIQIPAFLCRQTDLILAAAKTKKTINIKKGQFLAPGDVRFIVEKIRSAKNNNIFLTERGSCFGYNNLVVDFRSFAILKSLGYPVIFDVTHSVQLPSASKGKSGGQRQFVEPLAKAAVAFGIDGLFCEVHTSPLQALSDSATSLKITSLPKIFETIFKIRRALA
jgi:2-dehydro-3-deoxyphosphooctonate aldolase (KDO 8-P synthase)